MEFTTAVEVARTVRTGGRSAGDVAREALDRAERWGAALGAFAVLTPDLALAQAARVDAALRAGEPLGPLAGVPCPIKDLAEVDGVPFAGGSRALRGYVSTRTDAVARRLLDAGSVTIGKTATPEFGLPCYTEPEGAPPAVTPWDRSRGAGGSSGGAAAAVASGIVPIAHASDGGGSIRIPASSCGIVGFKPSRGLVPTGPERVPGPGLVSDGVVSRTVGDTALALDVLTAGPADGETWRVVGPEGGFATASLRDPGRLRVGVLTEPVISADAPVHPACRAAAEATARHLEALGHEVDVVGVPFPAERWSAFQAVWAVGALGVPLPEEAEPLLRPLTRWLREQGRRASGFEYARALADIQRLTHEVHAAWAGVDVVVTPTLAQPPAPVGSLRDDADPAADFAAQVDFTPWTSIANLTGRPSVSLPLHTAVVDGVVLPIGVMLTGRVGADARLLQLARRLEEAHPWPAVSPAWAASAPGAGRG